MLVLPEGASSFLQLESNRIAETKVITAKVVFLILLSLFRVGRNLYYL